jgi:hypothetical protein
MRSSDTLCDLHRAQGDEEREFLDLASKPWSTICQWFGLKTTGSGFSVWPQNRQLQFGDLGLKITTTVSWFVPQNQAGYGLSVTPQNRREDEDDAGHASG